jgi:Ion channel
VTAICGKTQDGKPPEGKAYSKDPASLHVLLGVLSFVLGTLGWFFGWGYGCFIFAVITDGYVFILLLLAALRADGYKCLQKLMPHKLFGFLLFILLFAGLVTSFAGVYIARGNVCDSSNVACISYTTSQQAGTGGRCLGLSKGSCETLRDGLYFSLVTITTVGYGDYAAKSDTRWIVIAEICSGALLLLLAFPLLVSRMSDWKD